MYELKSLFQNMNSFSKSDFVLPQIDDLAIPFGGRKLSSRGVCRNGYSKTDSQRVTRKKHSKEVEFERQSSQCRVQEQESDRYKIMNLLHHVNASKKTLDNNDVVSHCEETTETKVFIMERRHGNLPGRMVQMFWNQLKRLVGSGSGGGKAKADVAVKAQDHDPNLVGLVIEDKPLDEIALNDDDASDGSNAAAIKKKRNFLKKFAFKGKKETAVSAAADNENIFEPLHSVSNIVNDVQSQNHILKLLDVNKNEIYRLPSVECNTKQTSSDLQPDLNAEKKFFIMKFILAKKKPSTSSPT